MELAGYISQAGVLRDTRAMGLFWSSVSRKEWPTDPEALAEIEANFQGPFGDRRTEMVIIGKDMDKAAFTAQLDACLLSVDEMKCGPEAWQTLPDPFPSWVPTHESEE
jgi:G3E family GTPase